MIGLLYVSCFKSFVERYYIQPTYNYYTDLMLCLSLRPGECTPLALHKWLIIPEDTIVVGVRTHILVCGFYCLPDNDDPYRTWKGILLY